jgi:glycerol-3-phosphate dehydrogenase
VLDAKASLEAAPAVARLMAQEMGRDEAWIEAQVEDYRSLAEGYLLE